MEFPCDLADGQCSQIRQGIAGNTKGTAFVVYEDVMDAKQAFDKLNGFNFQNRYLVGRSHLLLFARPIKADRLIRMQRSPLSPAREDGKVQRGSRRTTGKPGETQTPAWNRVTGFCCSGSTLIEARTRRS